MGAAGGQGAGGAEGAGAGAAGGGPAGGPVAMLGVGGQGAGGLTEGPVAMLGVLKTGAAGGQGVLEGAGAAASADDQATSMNAIASEDPGAALGGGSSLGWLAEALRLGELQALGSVLEY
jgi:hypothetical protein